jgi:adenylate cyclase
MEFRIGAHVGDVRVDGERIYGSGVNIAARLENLAGAGEICLSVAVYDQVRRIVELSYEDLGDQVFKHIPDPIRAYRIRPSGASGAPRSAEPHATASRAAAPGRIQSLAVLPLENLSDDPEQEYFADGMTEALIGDLAKISALRVVSRTSVMQYKRVRKPLPEIARELNVDGVIEGSVIREGDRVRITVQLIDARRDHHLWAERYERYVHGILALQNEIARTVAAQIQLELTPEEEKLLEGPLNRWFARIRRAGVAQD